MKPFLYLLLMTVTLFFVFPVIVNAKVGLSVFPEKFDLELMPGDKYQGKIRLSNSTQNDLSINVRVLNFSAAGERGEISFFEDSDDISFDARQWIKFQEKSFILKKQTFKEISFNIVVPNNAEAGGYYLTVFFQQGIPSEVADEPLKIVANIGTLFLLKIKGGEEKYPSIEKQFEVVEFNMPSFIEKGPIAINFRLKNNDPVHIKVGGKMIIYNLFSKIKEEIEIKEQTILPGKIRFFELRTSDRKFFNKIFLGPYRAELILSTITWRERIGNNRQVVRETKFWGFPWKIISLVVVIILTIIFTHLFFRKKHYLPK